jgi:peptidase E
MTASEPTIIASSIGFRPRGTNTSDWDIDPIHRYAAQLANAGPEPKLCFIATAAGDQPQVISSMYGAFGPTEFRASHLALFMMPSVLDVREHLLAQDIIWVMGGSVVNLLAVWRAHGLDSILHEAWQAGVVIGGVSAGSICWHVGGTTDSFGPDLQPVTNGLGWLPYSNGVHYDSEAQRRPLFQRLIGNGTLPGGYATDDGAALVYRGTELAEAVATTPGAGAYAVRRTAPDEVDETPLDVRPIS